MSDDVFEYGAYGVNNPKTGEVEWLYSYRDLRGLIPDDIYEFLDALVGGYERELEDNQEEIKDWERWRDERLDDETRVFSDMLIQLDEILEKLNNRDKRLDRGDLIARFKEMREDVRQRF